jgi:hypothetical protein
MLEKDGPNLIIDTGLPLYCDKDIVLARVVFDLLHFMRKNGIA